MKFEINSKYKPAGDQPQAIEKLVKGLKEGNKYQTLLGVTGSGKTFTMANVIEKMQKPTLVIAHNKTLAAQLVSEYRAFFPKNAVEYFVSYYDYYQPEAYLANTDTYIEKDLEINQEIDRLRHASTQALLTRKDVIIVASVSCIYGLGSPEVYQKTFMLLEVDQEIERDDIVKKLIDMYFTRSDILVRGKFRISGETIDIMPADKEVIIRVELSSNTIKKITILDALTMEKLSQEKKMAIYPAKHFVVEETIKEKAYKNIEKELEDRLKYFDKAGKITEAERLNRRTRYDLEMLREVGYCSGIENYSRHLSDRLPGQAPYTLMEYFGKDFLTIIDESHVTLSQLHGMYAGDESRKKSLIDYGFRLPSAYDNRPLKFPEFVERTKQVIFTTATPGKFEKENSKQIIEQVIRPTGLIDPEVIVKKTENQIKDLMLEVKERAKRNERVLVTAITKKMAEELSEYLTEAGIKAEYLHSEVDTLDRIGILDKLREGKIDCLVGVNLLREGLDLPEVSLVAILDADKEGFLRSDVSLIQTIGRAARHVSGKVILYADNITGSMRRALDETNRRRKIQIAYNKKHGITPQTIKKELGSIIDHELNPEPAKEFVKIENLEDIPKVLKQKQAEMKKLAQELKFEQAALLRDEIVQLRKLRIK